MRFGSVPLCQAEGAILAHSMEAAQRPYDMQMTYRIPKGSKLTPQHIKDLEVEGLTHVVVAQIEPNDVEENAAAHRLAAAVVPDPEAQGIRIANAGAGRVNLYAAGCGVVRVDAQSVANVNATNPMITLATVPPFHRVDADGMIATIKIISYAVAENDLQNAEKAAGYALSVAAPAYVSADLIETQVTRNVPSKKGYEALGGRLQRLGMWLSDRVVVPHQEAPLAQALRDAQGEVLFILTGSATSDVRDVAPQALRLAGGDVRAYGMPVDPGNLLFFGYLNGKPVIGLPGCARSIALNGADWVMERLICGIEVTQADISAMGVGGLLKEIPTRPMPRKGKSGAVE